MDITMRIRRKPWARPELERCGFYVSEPQLNIGCWHELFERKKPVHLELGCGKGGFIASMAYKNRQINYMGIDIKSDVLGLAKRNIETVYNEENVPVDNIKIMSHDIERILLMMNEKDIIDRIYINFCNPWPKERSKKKRLTHTRQLEKYKVFIAPEAEIWFKTDDDGLFEESLRYFHDTGFKLKIVTYDLHGSRFKGLSVPTEHEKMFASLGIKIKFVIAGLL